MSGWRIESDGTPRGTRVYYEDKMVKGVQLVAWAIGVDGRAVARLKVIGPHLEVELPAGDVVVIGERQSRFSRLRRWRRRRAQSGRG